MMSCVDVAGFYFLHDAKDTICERSHRIPLLNGQSHGEQADSGGRFPAELRKTSYYSAHPIRLIKSERVKDWPICIREVTVMKKMNS